MNKEGQQQEKERETSGLKHAAKLPSGAVDHSERRGQQSLFFCCWVGDQIAVKLLAQPQSQLQSQGL
jgi:hypothetical protein